MVRSTWTPFSCSLSNLGAGSSPNKFQTTIQHTSLTLEESCHAAGDTKRVHLHAQLTFAQRIDRTSVADFVFEGVRPHVVPWLWYYSCSL